MRSMLLSCLLFGGVTWFGLADSYENVSSGKRGDAQARFNREAFFREVEQKQPESTKDFLMLLPENERRLYSLVYRSLAENRERVSADATFQPSGGTEKPSLQWSPPNPERCMECHRKSDNSYLGPRPIVDTYFNWPGWIGSNDDGVGSKRYRAFFEVPLEKLEISDREIKAKAKSQKKDMDIEFDAVERFQARLKKGEFKGTPYEALVDFEGRFYNPRHRKRAGHNYRYPRPNLAITDYLEEINSRRIGIELARAPAYEDFKSLIGLTLRLGDCRDRGFVPRFPDKDTESEDFFKMVLEPGVPEFSEWKKDWGLRDEVRHNEIHNLYSLFFALDRYFGADFSAGGAVSRNWAMAANSLRRKWNAVGLKPFSVSVIAEELDLPSIYWDGELNPEMCPKYHKEALAELERAHEKHPEAMRLIERDRAQVETFSHLNPTSNSSDSEYRQESPAQTFANHCLDCHDETSRYPILEPDYTNASRHSSMEAPAEESLRRMKLSTKQGMPKNAPSLDRKSKEAIVEYIRSIGN